MKIVLAPDSYKGSLSARAVAEAMRGGVLRVGDAKDAAMYFGETRWLWLVQP